jgi:hypothetical protein
MHQLSRREFRKSVPVADGMQWGIESAIKDVVTQNGPRGQLEEGASDAKSLIQRISATSLQEIDETLKELHSMRAALLAHNERIRIEIADYETANSRISGSLKSVSDILAQWKQALPVE